MSTPENAPTSHTGQNLYVHKWKDGRTCNMYFATKATTLWEAIIPLRWVWVMAAFFTLVDAVIARYFPVGYRVLESFQISNNGRMNMWLFILTVFLFLVDDVGTSVGMQAKEQPYDFYESNNGFCVFMEYLMINGVVDSHTSGFRLNTYLNLLSLIALQYFGLMRPAVSMWLITVSFLKARAGMGWWTVRPRNYSVIDFIIGLPGAMTPQRMGERARNLKNAYDSGKLNLHRNLLENADRWGLSDWVRLILGT